MILAECSWGSVWAAIPLHWPSSSDPAGTLNSEKTWAALSVWTSGSHFSPDVSSPHYGKGCQKCVPFCQSPYTVSIPQTSFSYELGLAFHLWLPTQLLSQTTGKSCSIHVTSNPGPPRGCPASLLTTNPNAFLTCFTPLDAEKQVCDRLAFESGSLPRVTAHPLDDPVLWTNKRSCWDVFGDILNPGMNYLPRWEMDGVHNTWWLKWKEWVACNQKQIPSLTGDGFQQMCSFTLIS